MEHITINPATGERLAVYPCWDDRQLEQALQRSARAAHLWREVGVEARCSLLRRCARLLREEQEVLGRQMSLEMGKPIREARSEVEKCARVCDFYADQAPALLADEPVPTEAEASYIIYRPLGPILAIMPWNFPCWQVFRFAAPALAAGNTILLKHAPSVTGCALAIEDLCRRAGLMDNVFTTLLIDHDQAARLIADDRLRGVTLTGSERAGSAVAAQAGRHIKKTVLELGGSDAFVVLEDADIDHAADIGVASRFVNGGQSCIAAKRFILAESIAELFIEAFHERAAQLVQGDPLDEATDIGPLARTDLVDVLERQVHASLGAGAIARLGCRRAGAVGNYYMPSILDAVTSSQPAGNEEVFGPVAAMLHARDATMAIELANASDFGLGCTICTRDTKWARTLADQIEAGTIFINSMVRSDPRLPFGGVKHSGYGRELARHGLYEFCNIKTVVQD